MHLYCVKQNISQFCSSYIYNVGITLIFAWISTLLGMFSTRFWIVSLGICAHSATNALVRSCTDVRSGSVAVPAHHKGIGLRSGFCTGHDTNFGKACLYGSHIVNRGNMFVPLSSRQGRYKAVIWDWEHSTVWRWHTCGCDSDHTFG